MVECDKLGALHVRVAADFTYAGGIATFIAGGQALALREEQFLPLVTTLVSSKPAKNRTGSGTLTLLRRQGIIHRGQL